MAVSSHHSVASLASLFMALVSCGTKAPNVDLATEADSSTSPPILSNAKRSPDATPTLGAKTTQDPYPREHSERAAAWIAAQNEYESKRPQQPLQAIPPTDMSDSPSMFGFENGSVLEIGILLVPSKLEEQSCLLPGVVKGLQCKWKELGVLNAPAPAPQSTLHYVEDRLEANVGVVAAGLASLEIVKQRLQHHPDVAVGLRCKVRVVGRAMLGYKNREAHPTSWTPGPFELGTFESCEFWQPPPFPG